MEEASSRAESLAELSKARIVAASQQTSWKHTFRHFDQTSLLSKFAATVEEPEYPDRIVNKRAISFSLLEPRGWGKRVLHHG
jgi:hypothetical protein